MFRYLLMRIGTGLLLLWAAMTLIFIMLQTVPGDPARQILGGETGDVSPEALAAAREQLGLDRPVAEQYWSFVSGVFTGDLGESFAYSVPVTTLLAPRLEVTLEIALLALIVGTAIGVALGAGAARLKGVPDLLASTFLSAFISVPVYVVGAVMVLIFAVTLGMLPSGGFTSIADSPVEHLTRIILPVVTLSIPVIAVVGRMTRSSVMENLQQDWVRTARSWGTAPNTVFNRHVLRNSLTSVATVVGLEAGSLIGSTVLVERIFNLPGIGSLLIEAVNGRDYPVVQGVVVVLCICFVILSVLVDVFYGVLDPRVRRRAL